MISLGNIDGLEQGFSSNKREMDETELEEGEACSYHDDGDNNSNNNNTIDPDVALSYIDEKLQNYLGHFKKDFEGVVSAESLGAKFGIYGSFLPAHRRSPHSRTPPRVQNNITPQSLTTLQAEGGHHNTPPTANTSSSIKQGSASACSASSYAYKPSQQTVLTNQKSSTKFNQSKEERASKSEVRDKKTLKVRIKVGSENLLVKKNTAIYNGLGLDGSPSSSLDDSPMKSEKLSCGLAFNSFESPTHILQIMMSPPLLESCFLSPLSNDLMCLNERPKCVKDQEAFSVVKSKDVVDRRTLYSQHKRDGKDNSIGSPLQLNENAIVAMSCEELVSNASKLPLLSDAHNNMKVSPRASLDERVFSDASKKELSEPVSVHASLSEKPKEMSASSGKPLCNGVAHVGDVSETEDGSANVGTFLKSQKVLKFGLKDPMNEGNGISSSHNDDIFLPCAIEHTLSGDEKKPVKSHAHGFSTKYIPVETNKNSTKVQKCRKQTDSENKAQKNEVQKDLRKVRDQYIDVFGEMDDLEVEIMDSPDVRTNRMLKSLEDVDMTASVNENISRERTSFLDAHKGTCLVAKHREPSNSACVPENSLPLSEPSPVPVDGKDNWVQCDKCQKWRMFPPGSEVDNLPAEWDCSLMTWMAHRNHCSVSEEESNNFQAPPFGSTAANILSTVVPNNGNNTGHDKVRNRKGRRGSDQEFSRVFKKSKTSSMQSGNNDPVSSHDQDVDILGVNSNYGFGAPAAQKDRISYSENFILDNSKDDMKSIPSDPLNKLKVQVEQLPTVGSVHISKSGSMNKKRKSDKLKDSPISAPPVKLVNDDEGSSRKRHRISKSDGKESSSSKRNGKADRKSKNVSHHRSDTNKSLPKDSSCVNPVATTSSSSKVSGFLKVKCRFQEVKNSPVESVSSSPVRIRNSDKFASESKVYNVSDAVKMATNSPTRCSNADYKVDQSGAIGKDLIAYDNIHGSPNYSMVDAEDKSKRSIQLTNGNGCIDNVKLDNGYPLEAQTSRRCVNEATGDELQLDANGFNSSKSWKCSPSLLKGKISKSNSFKGEIKASGSYENSLDHTSVSEETEHGKKSNFDEKRRCVTDKNENCTTMYSKEPSLPKCEGRQEYDEKKISWKFEVDKSQDKPLVSAKEKSCQLPHSDGDTNDASNVLQPCQGNKATISTCYARPDSGLSQESNLNKKANSLNGTPFPSKHPISNGHRIKSQDAPSPFRRDSSSQAASTAIKEAKDLKHLADRLKSSGSTDSTGMYFEAALKFLHGASLLESGKSDNIKHADIAQSILIYSSTAKLCQFCAHEFEKSRDMATAALAYKCVEVAYLRVIYSSHNIASRDRLELQHALQMVPPGDSPSSSASDIDNLNNANGDKVMQARSGGSPQPVANIVIAAKNRPNFKRILSFAQDVNFAMEASRKSRIAFAAANGSMGQSDSKDGITSIKKALDFNFYDVGGLLRLVRLAKEAISR